MAANPYERFSRDQLILRDFLAADRTVLASERTLLAYLRTALAFLITGGGIFHLYKGALATIGGLAFLGIGSVVLGFGIRRFTTMRNRLRHINDARPQARADHE